MVAELPFLQSRVPYVLAHRGLHPEGQENTAAAFAAAIEAGATHLETDVRVTADGVLVAFHDRRLERVTDGRGPVSSVTWEALRRIRVQGGEPVPRLEDLLTCWPQTFWNVDLKTAGAIAPFVEVVRRTGARDRVCVASFSERRRRAAVRALSDQGPVAWSPGAPRILAVWRAVRRGRPEAVREALAGAGCVQVPERVGRIRVVTPSLVEAVHAAGCQVHVWTVDAVQDMHRLLDLGIDAIITNRADLAIPLVRERAGRSSN